MYNVHEIEENINLYGEFRGRFLYGEPLAARTTFRVGGSAALLVEPADAESLRTVLRSARGRGVPFVVLGGGSNVVVPDEGISYAVVSTAALDGIRAGEGSVVCGAGCKTGELVEFCLAHSLGGLERFSGLPGTAGGAVYMNARCYELSASDVLKSVSYLDAEGTACSCAADLGGWGYKRSPFQGRLRGAVVVSTEFRVERLDADSLRTARADSEAFLQDRKEKGHFRYPSAGSAFKNNRAYGKPSGRIIDDCGLRGLSVGGAQVAPWHGNLIINTGNATADDIRRLSELVGERVRRQTGFRLEPEIIFLPSTKQSWPGSKKPIT